MQVINDRHIIRWRHLLYRVQGMGTCENSMKWCDGTEDDKERQNSVYVINPCRLYSLLFKFISRSALALTFQQEHDRELG